MKKLVALVLVLAIFVSTNITGFAISPNSFGANENFQLSEFEEINQSDLELSGEVTEELETESVKEILGYKIPQEPTVALDPAEAMIYEGEGNVYTILTAMDEQSRITKLYRNGVLRQKALGDRYSNLIYTELYDIELTSPDETLVQVNPESSFQKIDGETQEIKEENGFTYITVHKPVSSEVLDIPSNTGMIISQSAAASTYAASKSPMEDEPPTNDGLSKSQFSGDLDYFKLGSNSISYDGSQLYTGTLYRRISSFKHMGTAREPYKISPGTAVGTVISAIGLFLDPSKISVLLGIGSVVTTEVFNYATSVQVNIYNLDGDYKVRVNSAGNNPYFTTRRITSYYKVYNTYLDRCEYQIRRIEDGYPLSNPNLVNEGISNYGYYHFFDIIEHWAKDNIRWAYGKNFMSGTGEYKFSPEASCNRAMAITVIYRMAGQPNEGTSSGFTDVKSNDYFAKAVTWGKNHKIVSGTSSTTYSPNQNVTKEQFVLMLYNYAKYKGKNLTASGDLNKFTDALNKKNPGAIVFKTATGAFLRLRRDNFSSEEEFQKWKDWSDEDYRVSDNRNSTYMKHTVCIEDTTEQGETPSPEQLLFEQYDQLDRERFVNLLLEGINTCLSEPQRRRLLKYYFEGQTQEEIAQSENVAHQNVAESLWRAKENLRKFFKKAML